MPLCKNCDTDYGSAPYCLWCEYRREELLERLRPDGKVATLVEVSAWAMFGEREMPERCWRVE